MEYRRDLSDPTMTLVFAQIRNLSKPMWVLFWATLVNRMGTMVVPFLLIYLTKYLHVPPEKAALIFWVYGATALFLSPNFGWLADRFGAEKVMVVSLISFSVVLFAFSFVQNFTQAMIGSFFLAATGEAFRPAAMSSIAEYATAEQRKVALAFNRLAINLGMSLGPLVGGLIVVHSYPALFWIDGVTSLLAASILIIFLWPETKLMRENAEKPARERGAFKQVLADRTFLYFALSLIPVSMVFFQHESSLSIYMTHHLGLKESWYGFVFTINTILIILFEIPLNFYTSHWSHRKSLSLGCLFFAVGFGCTLFADTAVKIMMTVAIWTVGEMILFPAMANYVSELAPRGRQGLYMGVYSMAFSIAFIVGPWLGTTVLSKFGTTSLWTGCFIFAALSSLMMLRIHRRASAVV